MGETSGGKDDIQVLRDVLLKPLYEQNKTRDQQLVKFVEQFGAKLTTRLGDLEKRVELLAAEIDKRENMDSGISQGIASLGQELRQLASKAESLNAAPASQRATRTEADKAELRHPQAASGETDEGGPRRRATINVESDEADSPARETARAELDGFEPDSGQAIDGESDWDEPVQREAAVAESDPDEPLPREAVEAESDWDELPAREAAIAESDQPAPPSRESVRVASDQAERPRLRKAILRNGVQAVLPSRGVG